MTVMPRPAYCVSPFLVWVLYCAGLHSPSAVCEEIALREQVVAIDWKRFERPISHSEDYDCCAQILLNSAHYNLNWAPGAAERMEREWRNLTGRQAHDVIRPEIGRAHV